MISEELFIVSNVKGIRLSASLGRDRSTYSKITKSGLKVSIIELRSASSYLVLCTYLTSPKVLL